MFYEGDLQSGIALAVRQSKAVLCFVYDENQKSAEWQSILEGDKVQEALAVHAISFKLKAESQEAGFLGGICPVNSTPAVVVIKDARLKADLQSDQVDTVYLEARLLSSISSQADNNQRSSLASDNAFGMSASSQQQSEETVHGHAEGLASPPTADPTHYIHLEPSSARMRLPNNAYDFLRSQTEKMLEERTPHARIFETQLNMIRKVPTFQPDVTRLQKECGKRKLQLSNSTTDRLLRMPAAAVRIQTRHTAAQSRAESSTQTQQNTRPSPNSTSSSPVARSVGTVIQQPETTPEGVNERNYMIANTQSDTQEAQRIDYIKMQREREQAQKDERERIKAQIKADREERRQNEQLRKQVQTNSGNHEPTTSGKPKNTDIRIQVRTFVGSTLRQSFPHTSTLGKDVRYWIDSSTESSLPYNLKLILTPLPNRNIEATEEEQTLSDVGLRGSATLVMVPVKGYVESYTGSTPGGLVGSALSGGYNLVSGTTGMLYSGLKSVFGYGETQESSASNTSSTQNDASRTLATQRNVKVRTLADQRSEDAKKDQQFYNGNQLNFEPNKDDENSRKDD